MAELVADQPLHGAERIERRLDLGEETEQLGEDGDGAELVDDARRPGDAGGEDVRGRARREVRPQTVDRTRRLRLQLAREAHQNGTLRGEVDHWPSPRTRTRCRNWPRRCHHFSNASSPWPTRLPVAVSFQRGPARVIMPPCLMYGSSSG